MISNLGEVEMKINKLWFYVAGFVMGVALAVIIVTWGAATIAYRIVYIVLLGLLLFATWSKPKSYKGDDNTDNNPLYAPVSKPLNKSGDSTTKS
jgi:hypothetical protein